MLEVAILVVLTLGVAFFGEWKSSRRKDQEYKERELKLREYEIESNPRSAQINVDNSNTSPEESKTDLNGYVFLSVSENKKSLFSEMLKGFEEYAKLKGYHVSLSIDASIRDKVGFKFTLHEQGVSVSTSKVKNDINEYINNIMSGGDFDNMPVLITPEEHSAVIGTLKARIKYMEYTYALEKTSIEFYQSIIHKMANSSINHSPANINVIHEGIEMDGRSYSADNSANVVQGDKSKNSIKHSNIHIGNNVSEINSQLNVLNEVIKAVEAEASVNIELKPATRHLENTKEELEESRSPDGASISKWLKKTNLIIKTANTSAETISKFSGLLKMFGLSL